MELQDRAGDGLWGRVKWTNEGRAMVTSGNYKFISPVWNVREVPAKTAVLSSVRKTF